MQKIVLKVDVVGDGCKAKAMSTVAKFQGINYHICFTCT